MKRSKRLLAWLCPLVLLMTCCIPSVRAAGTEPGVYTADMVVSYYNPDTGTVDDGGTSNAALGDGMCRSATNKTCLVEVDQDGSVWITVRLLLQSSCKDVALYSRTGYNSYSQASYEITSEDAGTDSIDYRIKVADVGTKLKASMYVTPMGRDVLWYLYVDTATLTEGSGDFLVSIDPDAGQAASATPQATPTPTPAAAASPTPSAWPAVSPAPSAAVTSQPAQTSETTPESSPSPQMEESAAPEESTEPAETPDTASEASASPETVQPSPSDAAGDSIPQQESASPVGMTGVVVAVLVVAVVGAVVYFLKRKR